MCSRTGRYISTIACRLLCVKYRNTDGDVGILFLDPMHTMDLMIAKRGYYGLLLPTLAVLCLCIPPQRGNSLNSGLREPMLDSSFVSLYIPLEKISIAMIDESGRSALPEVSEAFFIEVANALVQYEVAQRFKVLHQTAPDTPAAPSSTAACLASGSFRSTIQAQPEKVGEAVRSIASQCSVDLVVLPIKASVKETLGKRGGWRKDKYGQSYEQPVLCIAEASISIQMWDRHGTMVYASSGKGTTKQPLFYSLFKREKPKKEDLVHFSKNVFAPPLIRALNSAVNEIFPAQQAVSNRGRRY